MNYLVLHVTGRALSFARFQKRRGALVFTGGARYPLDEGQPLTEILAQVKSAGVVQERIIVSLPASSLFLREIELPMTDRRKIREVLPLELKGETALDAEELVFDGMPLGDGKVLAIWTKRRELAEQIAMLTDAGLEPEIVTSSLFHWHALAGHVAGTCAVTEGDALAVYTDGKPIFFRPLHSGEYSEIARTIAALQLGKGIEVEKLLLHGGASRSLTAAPDDIPHAPVPIAGDLASAFPDDGEAPVELAGAYAVVRACMIGDEVNFRTGSLAYTAGDEKLRRKLRLSLALAAACILLIFAEAGIRYMLVKRDLASLNRSIGQMYKEVFPARKKPVDEVAELKSEIKRLGGGAATGTALAALNKLAEAKGDDITGIYEAEIEGGQARVKGDARSFQAVNDFKAKASASFSGAEVGEVKSRPDGSVSFLFRGTIKEEGK